MLPKERVIAALEHREADRVPIGEQGVDWEVTDRALGVQTLYRAKWRQYTALWEGRRDEIAESHWRDLVGLTRKFEWDFVVVPTVPARKGSYYVPETLGDYTWRDETGRVWQYSPDSGGHAMVKEYPPMTIDDIPDPDGPFSIDASEFEAMERVVKEIGRTHFVFGRVPDGTFPWQETVGLEDYLTKMITEPEFVRKAAAYHTNKSIAYVKAAAATGIDGILVGTDYADNHGPMMGPRLFREFLLPWLAATAKAAHDEGLFFVKHTDGNLWSVLDDFVAAGVDGWQGIQPRIGMDMKLLKEKYAGKLTLVGGVNCETLTLGTQEDVEEEVKYAIRHAAPGGGLMMCSGNTLMPGTKYENYLAMVDANRRYGKYPIGGF